MFKNMAFHIKQKNCSCRKDEYCTNGLECTEQNCFLLKSSTIGPTLPAIPIDNLNPILSILSSDYIQIQPVRDSNIRGFSNPVSNKSNASDELNYALKQK